MSEASVTDNLAERVAALRVRFEHSFAEPAQTDATVKQDFLAVRVGDDVFAIRLAEISGLYAGNTVRRLPGADPALLGITGFRGTIRPVYSLARLLGLSTTASPRWLVIAAAAPVAFAFDAFEHHLRVAPDAIRSRDANVKDQAYVRDFVPIQQFVRPILHLPSIIETIRTRNLAMASGKES